METHRARDQRPSNYHRPRPVNRDGQTFSLEMSLGMTLPMPPQDEHLPDQIEAHVHQAGLEIQRKLFQVLIEKADQELVLQQRHGKGGAGIQRRGTRPHMGRVGTMQAPRDELVAPRSAGLGGLGSRAAQR
ncbi:MAG: hypothetical protein ACHRXM_38835 [Isosphaerales bacterium]